MGAADECQSFDRMIVLGDVNSTMAAAKVLVPVAHAETGLRSFDREMPAEINRTLTDSFFDMLLCSEPAGVENLIREGHDPATIHIVGNVMIDTLLTQVERAKAAGTPTKLGLEPGCYGVVTLHHPSNVDDRETLTALLEVLQDVSQRLPLVFPVHPRTRARIETFGLQSLVEQSAGIRLLEPQGYLDFLCLTSQAKVIVTDSGGLQEESTALGVPCLTMRANTERPITCSEGSGTLIGSSAPQLREQFEMVIRGKYKAGVCPELWDGKASERIVKILLE
ncbi:UDP-N-acetyl glucosamine 2-epimerase, partial [Rhodopirellula sallentina]